MFCMKCGAKIADGAAFCQACGNPVGAVDASAQSQPTQNIKPNEPMETKSSVATPVFSNFLATYTTSRRLCSMSSFFASSLFSPESACNRRVSSSEDNGGGKISLLPIK